MTRWREKNISTDVGSIRRWSIVFVILPDLMKVILVKLAHKGRKIAMLKMFRKNSLRKLVVLNPLLLMEMKEIILDDKPRALRNYRGSLPIEQCDCTWNPLTF